MNTTEKAKKALDRLVEGRGADEAGLEALLLDETTAPSLFEAADRVRREQVGDEVHLRALIEISSVCERSCLYCGLRRENTALRRYALGADHIVAMARDAAEMGYRTVVLQGGESRAHSPEALTDMVRRIKTLGLAVTLSLGEWPDAVYTALRDAGADRYLLRIETSDRELYQRVSPGMSWENRVRCLRTLGALGFEVGTGSLVGLPGQSVRSLARDLLFFRELNADMVGLGPFIPNPQTPLGGEPAGSLDLAMRMMSLARLLLPEANIPATTAMEVLDPRARLLALARGANVVMPNATSGEARRLYALYPGKICVDETPTHCRTCITGKIAAIGRPVADHAGFRRRKTVASST